MCSMLHSRYLLKATSLRTRPKEKFLHSKNRRNRREICIFCLFNYLHLTELSTLAVAGSHCAHVKIFVDFPNSFRMFFKRLMIFI